MKQKLTHNLGMKILSIVLAVLVWLIIVNIDDPITTIVVNGIEIELENADVLLDAGLTYTVAGNLTASIQVPVRRTVANSVKASDFRAVADCAAMYSPTGQVPVTVTKTNNSLHLEGTIDQITESVQLEIEEIQTQTFDIQVVLSGEPGDAYTVGSAAVTPEIVTVTAPESIMRSIREARAVVNLDGMTESGDQETEITFIDVYGQTMDLAGNDQVKVSHETVTASVIILNKATVGFTFNIVGTDALAEGYRYTGLEYSPQTVEISGFKSVLAEIHTIDVTDEINLTGSSESKQYTFHIRDYLPENVRLTSDESDELTVTVNIEQLSEKTYLIPVSGITRSGEADGFTYSYLTENVSVQVRGLAEDLELLDEESITASLDLSEATEGSNRLTPEITLPEGFTLGDVSTVTVVMAQETQEETTEITEDSNTL